MFKSVFTVSFYTLISRILGFIRDIFIASYLGSTLVADAFFVAFRIPNYFRRVFAEGAFSAAFIPVYSGLVHQKEKNKDALSFINQTMSILIFSILLIAIIFHFIMPQVILVLAPGFVGDEETFNLAVHFGRIIFPYLLFVALVAQFTSITNTYNKFAFGAFAPALLNIAFIGSLIFLTPFVITPAHALSYGVLLGGVVQVGMMYFAIYKIQITPTLVLPKINNNIIKFFKLFFPGVLGGAAIQLNIIVGTIIASFLPTGSISHLYYADRITQLPLGMFGIALGIALLPTLSKLIKENADIKKIISIQNRSIEFALLISIPSAIGLYMLAEPIIKILFERGAFVSADTFFTSRALSLFALGLPAYILIKVLNPSFYSREDTKTPFYITLFCVLINIIISLILIGSYRELGIALATAIASWFNVILLYIILSKRGYMSIDKQIKINFLKIIISSFIMFIVVLLLKNLFFLQITTTNYILSILLLLITILIAIIIFGIMIFMLKIYTIEEIQKNMKK